MSGECPTLSGSLTALVIRWHRFVTVFNAEVVRGIISHSFSSYCILNMVALSEFCASYCKK